MKFALLIEYDGTDFAGWQVQKSDRTVQGEIERGLESIYGQPITLYGAGRTDAGVHGAGMVAHFEVPEPNKLNTFKLIAALNSRTPEDIVIHDIREVPEDFQARFSAISREYTYTICRSRSAIDRRRVWSLMHKLDNVSLEQCAEMLIGEHDFTSFSKRSDDVNHYRCTIQKCEWKRDGIYFVLTIKANRFVRGQVRAIVGAMVAVALGKLEATSFAQLLHEPVELDRAKFLAPAHGLVLTRVEYPPHFGLW